MNTEIEKIFVDILSTEMEIDSQNIWIDSQNREIPSTDDLFVIVGMVDSQVYSSKRTIEPTDAGMTQYQEVVMRETIQIDLISSTKEARQRRSEVIMSLTSLMSEQKQEEEQFKIFRIPTSFINASEAEGGSTLNRFSIIVPVFVWYKKTKILEAATGEYYDKFSTRVDVEETIDDLVGMIEITEP